MQFPFTPRLQWLLAVNVIVTTVPDHDSAAAVLSRRDNSFEDGVFDGVIFHFYRKMFLSLRPW